jgi:DNA-binding CsgD family transcriptional regulator
MAIQDASIGTRERTLVRRVGVSVAPLELSFVRVDTIHWTTRCRVSELKPIRREVLLSANQNAIVERLLAGDKGPAIARAKKRSVDTVRQTIRAIYSKFGVRDTAELATGIAEGRFNIRVTDGNGREHNLRSAVTAMHRAVANMRSENLRKGTRRRRVPLHLHEDEIGAILVALGEAHSSE